VTPAVASATTKPAPTPPPAAPAVTTAQPKPASAEVKPPAVPVKPKFTKAQVASRLKYLKYLYEEGLLMDDFYDAKVAECETAQDDAPAKK
jgi:hypothetical protein